MVALSPETARFLFLRSSQGILIADGSGMLVSVNPAALAMLGIASETAIGKTPARVFSSNPALINLFQRPGEQTLDVRLPRRRLAIGSGSTGEAGERIVLLHDVTEQRDLDSRRESLINTIAHDLRNPIAAIHGFAELLGKSGELNPDQTHFLTRVLTTTQKLQDVVKTLTDLAWLEAGMPLEHIPVDLGKWIDAALTEFSPAAHLKAITLLVSVQNPLPMVMGDPARIASVIRAILHNAIQYSDMEKIIAIHAWGDAREVYCSIADQGIGIGDNEIESVFDRLYRSRDPRVQAQPGGGLGLTLARRILRRHGGDIWAASNIGKGSTFTFVLPAGTVSGISAPLSVPATGRLKG